MYKKQMINFIDRWRKHVFKELAVFTKTNLRKMKMMQFFEDLENDCLWNHLTILQLPIPLS
jgi:hypothetical protein